MRRTPASVSRPLLFPYDLKAMKDLPRRMLNPPPAPCKVNSWKISPDFHIDLDDILENKHLPPMALKDFEEYLLFTEFAAENLYFTMWLREYTRLHAIYTTQQLVNVPNQPPMANSDSELVSEGDLALLFTRALTTFFDPTSHLALNLPHDLSAPVLALPSTTSHPSPTSFSGVQTHVKEMLRESLSRFLRISYGNAAKNRSWFAVTFGGVSVLLGVMIVLLGLWKGWPRAVRVVVLPLFVLGFTGIVAGMHGVCMIIWTFADARQLHPYELAAPRIPDAISPSSRPATRPVTNTTTPSDAKVGTSTLFSSLSHLTKVTSNTHTTTEIELEDRFTALDIEERKVGSKRRSLDHRDRGRGRDDKAEDDDDDDDKTAQATRTTATRSYLDTDNDTELTHHDLFLYTASFIPSTTSHTHTHSDPPPSYNNTILSPSSFIFDFDALPPPPPRPTPSRAHAHSNSKHSRGSSKSSYTTGSGNTSSPTFGSLTRVLNPIVVRSQWEVAARSFLVSVVLSCMLLGVCLGVPWIRAG